MHAHREHADTTQHFSRVSYLLASSISRHGLPSQEGTM
jgi:hypothetical protein